jgi:hypothetical protein
LEGLYSSGPKTIEVSAAFLKADMINLSSRAARATIDVNFRDGGDEVFIGRTVLVLTLTTSTLNILKLSDLRNNFLLK